MDPLGTILTALLSAPQHISLIMFLNGLMMLIPPGLDRSSSSKIKNEKGELKTWIQLVTGWSQLTSGVLSVWSGASYTQDILFASRPANAAALVTLFGGGMASFAAATRKWPWALLFGLGFGGLGGAGVFYLGSVGLGAPENPVAAVAIITGAILFYGIWIIAKPPEDFLHTLGDITSFSGAAVLIGMIQAILGVVSGFGMVVF